MKTRLEGHPDRNAPGRPADAPGAARRPVGQAAQASAYIICDCRGISLGTLRAAFERGARTPGALARETGAGTGCGSCRGDLRRLTRRWRQPAWWRWLRGDR